MKIFFKISDTGGYPEGIIPHMIKAISAVRFHLNYFYDAYIFKYMVDRYQFRQQLNQKTGKK